MAIASSNKFPKVIYAISTGVAAASTGHYNSWMSTAGKFTVTSSGGTETVIGPTTASGAVPVDSLIGRLYTRPTSTHADDDEFASASSGSYTALNIGSGSATWTHAAHGLSVVFENQAVSDVSAYMKTLTATQPFTIEAGMIMGRGGGQYAFAGVCVSDGTNSTNAVVTAMMSRDANNVSPIVRGDDGTFTTVTGAAQVTDIRSDAPHHGHFFVRLISTAANTFKVGYSIDSISWVYTGTFTHTITPSKLGFCVTEWGGGATNKHLAFYEYIRVSGSDLSA